MILFFGPAGAGKSMQGKLLSARHDWPWISTGKLFRETSDSEILKTISDGNLISDEQTNAVLKKALLDNKDNKEIILDGYPRRVEQARWLVENSDLLGHTVSAAIVVDVPKGELLKRMQLRGRHDDTPESIEKRLNIFRQEINPMLDYFKQQSIPVAKISGVGRVGEIHDRVEAELTKYLLDHSG